jgi:hypothetical protein
LTRDTTAPPHIESPTRDRASGFKTASTIYIQCTANASYSLDRGTEDLLTCIAGSHPLLQQTYLSVSPFIDLPKTPTLPPNYATLPSTLPPSTLHAQPTASAPDLPAYVVSATGGFATHPSTIAAQNRALLEQIEKDQQSGRTKVEAWEEEIKERELQERRRRAPGWLDRDEKMLVPERKETPGQEKNLIDDDRDVKEGDRMEQERVKEGKRKVEELGDALDRAFGRSEMG